MLSRPAVSAVLLALLLALAVAASASATFSGSNGKVAFVGHDQQLYIDDPWDDEPAKAFGKVASDDPTHVMAAGSHGPSWSPDGTMLAYTAPVPDTFGLEHSAVFVRNADGSQPRQVSQPF